MSDPSLLLIGKMLLGCIVMLVLIIVLDHNDIVKKRWP